MIKQIALVALSLCFFSSCWLAPPPKSLEVYVHLKQKSMSQSSLLVLNFREPTYAAGKGAEMARIGQELLLQAKKFRVVALRLDSAWDRMGKSDEDRLKLALTDAARGGYDYVLAGELEEFVYGQMGKSRVRIRLRIMAVNTLVTVFYAANMREEAAKDLSYPLDTRLSQPAVAPDRLARQLLREIIHEL
jgi:hypothetical protein